MHRVSWLASIAPLSLLCIALVACGNGNGSQGSGGGDGKDKPKPSGLVVSSGEASKAGGYLVIPSPEPPFINPVLQNAFDLATPLIYEGLMGIDAKFEPVPLLAESYDRSEDGKTLTFHLRKNVQWHDGKPFSSDDVKFTIEAIQKSQAAAAFSSFVSTITKVETPDANTVSVTYQQPYGPDLATYTFGILPKHLYDGQDLAKSPTNMAPIGTGPYKFVRWVAHKEMILDASSNYWGTKANIEQIELVFPALIPQKDYLKALLAKKIDFAQIYEESDWTGTLHTPEFLEKFETATLDENVIMMIAWNNQKKPFDDKRVRIALTESMDRPRVIEDVLGGSARPVSGPFYPTLWGADPSIPPWPFDPAKAAAGFDAAGLPKKDNSRFKFELLVEDDWRGSSTYDNMLAIFSADLDKLGVDMKITYIPRGEVGDRLILHNFDAVMFEWAPDVPDPDPFELLQSSQGTNYAGYVNTDVDKLLDAGRRSNDRAKRKESYYALHKLVHEDEPYSFLFAPQSHYAWSRRIHGASPLDLSSLPRQPGVARWWVDK